MVCENLLFPRLNGPNIFPKVRLINSNRASPLWQPNRRQPAPWFQAFDTGAFPRNCWHEQQQHQQPELFSDYRLLVNLWNASATRDLRTNQVKNIIKLAGCCFFSSRVGKTGNSERGGTKKRSRVCGKLSGLSGFFPGMALGRKF